MALVAYEKHSRKNQSCFVCALSVDPKLNMLEKIWKGHTFQFQDAAYVCFSVVCFKKQVY